MACVGNPPFRLIIFSLESYDLDQTKWGITDMNGDYPHEWWFSYETEHGVI